MASDPGYTVKDLVFYTGLFGGIIAMYFILEPHEVMPVVVTAGLTSWLMFVLTGA